MTLKQVSTLGCNSLLMLHKLAAVDGLEILEAGTHTKFGTDYHYRVIARIADDMFIEAYDPLNEMIDVGDRRFVWGVGSPGADGGISFSMTDLLHQEMDETLWEVSTNTKNKAVVAGLAVPDLPNILSAANSYQGQVFPYIAPSSLVRFVGGADAMRSGAWFHSRGTGQCTCFRLRTGGGTVKFPFGTNGGTGVLSFDASSPASTHINGITYTTTEAKFLFESDVVPGLNISQPTAYRDYSQALIWPNNYSILGLDGVVCTSNGSYIPRLMSGAMIRVSSAINGEGGLVSPSDWFAFPICLSAISYVGDGILFMSENEPRPSQYIYVGVLDTEKGNGFNEGRSPVVARFSPVVFGANATDTSRIFAHGASAPLSGTKTMSTHSPVSPIGSDSVTGGPVVTNLFAIASDEIRGAFPPLLSCNSALALGTMGWLAGKRYKVIRPGLMIRVG